MKKTFRFVAVILIITMAITSLSACGKKKEQITNLLAEFEYSCNALDIDAILNCIDPAIANKIKLAFSIYGIITEQNTGDVLNEISDSLTGDSSLDGNDFFSSIIIEPKDIEVDGEEAVVSAAVQYKINGEDFNRMADFKCIYYMEEWYISQFYFV